MWSTIPTSTTSESTTNPPTSCGVQQHMMPITWYTYQCALFNSNPIVLFSLGIFKFHQNLWTKKSTSGRSSTDAFSSSVIQSILGSVHRVVPCRCAVSTTGFMGPMRCPSTADQLWSRCLPLSTALEYGDVDETGLPFCLAIPFIFLGYSFHFAWLFQRWRRPRLWISLYEPFRNVAWTKLRKNYLGTQLIYSSS